MVNLFTEGRGWVGIGCGVVSTRRMTREKVGRPVAARVSVEHRDGLGQPRAAPAPAVHQLTVHGTALQQADQRLLLVQLALQVTNPSIYNILLAHLHNFA